MLRWLTAGESHGPALVAMLEGLPAGVEITSEQVRAALARRRLGYGRGARMSFEADELEVVGGIRHGRTLGSPIALRIANSEWPKWDRVMAADPVDPAELATLKRNAPLTRPRPGHADLTGMQKYGFDEARPILERASARETAARVALGEVAAQFIRQTTGATVLSHVVELGSVKSASALLPTANDVEQLDADPLRCFDRQSSAAMVAEVDAAHKDGDTLGGVVEVLVEGLPPGLGSYTQWDRRLDGRLAQALMSIQAIKGVEVGDGFELARTRGSAAHDEIERVESDSQARSGQAPNSDQPTTLDRPTTTSQATISVRRVSGRAGGIEGGMSTGELLRIRAAMKPIATVPRALRTVDIATGDPAVAHHQRSDVCAVPAAGIVAEAMVALVVADAVVEKFGGDSVEQTARNVNTYLDNLSLR